jgi:hypothetical protein
VTGGALRLYLAVKFLHVIGAAILFGTGLGIAFFPFRAERKEEPEAIAATLRAVGDRRLCVHRDGGHRPTADRSRSRPPRRL